MHLLLDWTRLEYLASLFAFSNKQPVVFFKELLAEFRQELDAAKREIIEGMSA